MASVTSSARMRLAKRADRNEINPMANTPNIGDIGPQISIT